MDLDKITLSRDPLIFWKLHSQQFPLLSKLAEQIHSIPATSSSVEQQFSAAGLVINERRTNLSPHQLDNILLIRSLRKLNWFFQIIYCFCFAFLFYLYETEVLFSMNINWSLIKKEISISQGWSMSSIKNERIYLILDIDGTSN